MPLFLSLRMFAANTSTTNKNRRALSGQPCLIPFFNGKGLDVHPLLVTHESAFSYKTFTHCLKELPKLYFDKTLLRNSWLTVSKAL